MFSTGCEWHGWSDIMYPLTSADFFSFIMALMFFFANSIADGLLDLADVAEHLLPCNVDKALHVLSMQI
jgi:hypothetical protein